MVKYYQFTLLFILSTFASFGVMAQSDIASKFAGVYSVDYGPRQVQFVMYPQGTELRGNITFSGRDYPLSATIDGLTLKAVFGHDKERQFFRMPLSSTSRFEVTFADDNFGNWAFLRLPLPRFAGEFSGPFGKITLAATGQGLAAGEYVSDPNEQPLQVSAMSRGLEAQLQGDIAGKLLYSLDEHAYFAEIGGRFTPVNYKAPEVVEQERRIRVSRDNNAWRRALAKGTEDALETYRLDWPRGLHLDKIPAAKEQLHWQQTLASSKFHDYIHHIKRYPNGRFALQADDAAWAISRKPNTDDAYNQYLKALPNGTYAQDAYKGIDELAWYRATLKENISDYGEYAKAHPKGAHIETADQLAWKIAKSVQSQTAFNAYKRAFPTGIHAAKVDDAKANVKAILADNAAYKLARKRDTQAGYNAYLTEYPEGRHAKKANAGIEALVAAAHAQKDDMAWQKALAAQSESAINFYSITWPNGRHIDEVSSALIRLKQLETNKMDSKAFAIAQRVNSADAYSQYLSQYHSGLHKEQAQQAIATINEQVRAKEQMISSAQSMLAQLGYLNMLPDGQLNRPTKAATVEFQRAMKLTPNGKVDNTLVAQLNQVVQFNDNLKAAKKGSGTHMLAVAENYFFGHGTQSHLKKALNWYQKAADEGNPQAMARLGKSLVNGMGIDKNVKQGLKWLKKSVRFNNDDAMVALGLLYLNGQGVRQNNKKGMGWLMRSAEYGNTDAMKHLGDIYAQGKGVKKDLKAANQWYEKASDTE